LLRGTIEPSLSFSPEQRTRLDLFWEAGVEYFTIKNWDRYQADVTMDQDLLNRCASGVMVQKSQQACYRKAGSRG